MGIKLNERQRIQARQIIRRIREVNSLDITVIDAFDIIDAVLAEIDFSGDSTMTITVIQVIQAGTLGYVASESCLSPGAVVKNAFDAIDYTDDPDGLARALDAMVTPFDECYAKSGLRIDHLPVVVEMDLYGEVIKSYIGRMPHHG